MRSILILLVCSGLLSMGNAQGTPAENPKAGKLSVTGVGNVMVTPDVAKVYLSVSVTRPTANAACQQAATTTTAVRDALEGVAGLVPEDVTTENYNVSPNYVYAPETQQQKISGYTCSQSMVVKIDGVNNTNLAAVIDASVKAGGNDLQVSQVAMDLSPELRRQATNEARQAAVDDAVETAALLAKSAEVTLGSITSITDQNQAPAPPMPMASAGAVAGAPAMDAAAATPVQIGDTTIGDTTVTATVFMEYAFTD